MNILLNGIDRFTDLTGRMLSWLIIAMMVVLFAVVILRYGLNTGSVFMQESVTYLHAAVFMLGAAYTLQKGGHVRVDIFYRNFSPRSQAWINSLGGIIFLLPICFYIGFISWEFVEQSWLIREVSTEPGGIPAVFLLKTLIPLMAINLGLQAIAEIIRNAKRLV